jgi:hypothetical protein
MDAGEARWPVWSMLLYGHFGRDATPASRRADLRSRVAIGVFVAAAVAITALAGPEPTVHRDALSALVGLLLAYLAWERWRYAAGLDELTRRLYLEAFAVTYLIGLTSFAALTLLQPVTGWTVPPIAWLALEPVRAAVLAWRSRRFA